jgi:hypothetical protein
MEHDLKCWPHAFEAIRDGRKRFEVRSDVDRAFAAGDVLVLRKWSPTAHAFFREAEYVDAARTAWTSQSGLAETVRARVTYVLHGGQFGLPPGLCVMSIELCT